MNRARTLVMLSAAVATSTAIVQADELYRQDPIQAVGGYSSQDARNPGGLGWFSEVIDNFPGQAGWQVGQVEFWGGYVTTIPGHTQGFSVHFYADSDGAPGDLLLAQDVMSFTETVYYNIPGQDWNGYHYVVNLGQTFTVPTTGQYWMSVVAILDRGGTADEPQWGWVQSPSINPPPAVQRWFGGTLNPGVDMSFVLNTPAGPTCGSADFNCDGDSGTDADIEAFFACIAGSCPSAPCTSTADFNGDGDVGTDADIEAFFRVLAGGTC